MCYRSQQSNCKKITINYKYNTCIGTWNVRTFIQNGKLQIINTEMVRLNMNTLSICEMRWPFAGEKYLHKNRIIYPGVVRRSGRRHFKSANCLKL